LLGVHSCPHPTQGGTPYKLPNGMTISHWQELETKFLYDEIFGDKSPYNRNGHIKFAPGQTIVDAGAWARSNVHGKGHALAAVAAPNV
jgi:hypothetical protein